MQPAMWVQHARRQALGTLRPFRRLPAFDVWALLTHHHHPQLSEVAARLHGTRPAHAQTRCLHNEPGHAPHLDAPSGDRRQGATRRGGGVVVKNTRGVEPTQEVPLLAGHCGLTRVGSKCAAPGESGAWQTGPWAAQLGSLSPRKRNHQLLMMCLQECSRCDTCSYISFSLSQQDCSWYASCNMSQLTIAGDVVSARLDRTLLPPTRTTSPFLTPPRHQPRMQHLAAQRCQSRCERTASARRQAESRRQKGSCRSMCNGRTTCLTT